MALSLIIKYKDSRRKALHHPFSFQSVLRECWWPLARKLGLPMLERLECLFITERAEAEQLLVELRAIDRQLRLPSQTDVSPRTKEYMLRRLEEVLPILEQALAEWDQVAGLSL